MADQETIDYYKSWLHEQRRATKLGKTNYYDNCHIERVRLETEYPELVGEDCGCAECQG